MNFTVYTKPYLFIGIIIGVSGSALLETKVIPTYLGMLLMLSGIVFILLSMKKPKEAKN